MHIFASLIPILMIIIYRNRYDLLKMKNSLEQEVDDNIELNDSAIDLIYDKIELIDQLPDEIKFKILNKIFDN